MNKKGKSGRTLRLKMSFEEAVSDLLRVSPAQKQDRKAQKPTKKRDGKQR